MEYQSLSNLLKKREKPFKRESGSGSEMTTSEIENATKEIRREMPHFDYMAHLKTLCDDTYMAKVYKEAAFNYEKLQIFRIIKKDMSGIDVIDKFINETFHIENEYVMQLNPCKYEIVPQYIIEKCDCLLCTP